MYGRVFLYHFGVEIGFTYGEDILKDGRLVPQVRRRCGPSPEGCAQQNESMMRQLDVDTAHVTAYIVLADASFETLASPKLLPAQALLLCSRASRRGLFVSPTETVHPPAGLDSLWRKNMSQVRVQARKCYQLQPAGG